MPRRPTPLDVLNATVPLRGLTLAHGLAYGPHARQALDLYRPADARARLPVLVWFHGGAWQSGQRTDCRFVAAPLARRGMLVAVPDYRLFPEVRFPDFLRDAAAAVAHVRRIAAAHGGDPDRIVLAGHSAGAYIAAMLALDARWLGARQGIAGAVGLGGPYDFLPIRRPDISAIFAPARDPRETQPAHFANGDSPPLLLLHGTRDGTCWPRNSLALAARVRAAGGEARVVLYRGTGHIGIVLGFVPWLARCRTLADVSGFVATSLARRPTKAIQPAA